MKDKKIFKKWWFWAIVAVVVLGAIGSLGGQTSNNTSDTNQASNSQQASPDSKSTLPKLNAGDYTSKEGLLVYKELQGKGYKVEAEFEKQALTDINGKASDVFKPLDPNKTENRQSVDAFVVGSVTQDGDSVTLTIAHSPTN